MRGILDAWFAKDGGNLSGTFGDGGLETVSESRIPQQGTNIQALSTDSRDINPETPDLICCAAACGRGYWASDLFVFFVTGSRTPARGGICQA